MAERRGGRQHAGVADQHIEPPVALVERQRQPRDAVGVFDVERHQRGGAAGRFDLVVEFFQAADRARHRHDMGARFGEMQRQRRADAARGAGDERNAVGEGFRVIGIYRHPGSRLTTSCRCSV